MAIKAQLYKCYGGPLDGHRVTDQYAGSDYTRYNSSCGEVCPRYKYVEGNYYVGKAWLKKRLKITPTPYIEKCILVYTPSPGVIKV